MRILVYLQATSSSLLPTCKCFQHQFNSSTCLHAAALVTVYNPSKYARPHAPVCVCACVLFKMERLSLFAHLRVTVSSSYHFNICVCALESYCLFILWGGHCDQRGFALSVFFFSFRMSWTQHSSTTAPQCQTRVYPPHLSFTASCSVSHS